MEVIETTTLGWWIIEKIILVILIPISFYAAGRMHGERRARESMKTDFDFENQKES